MAFDPFQIDLPIRDILNGVKESLRQENNLIVHAPPGAGKSTLLPLALLQEAWLSGQKIIMLEPRRLAARSVAMRMADLLGQKVGESIGYRIRFETRVSDQTIIEVVTEGILTRMLHSDNALTGIALVIFDEFHERSIHADVALALCRESQEVLRPDLKLLIMSATLDIPNLKSVLQAPILESLGRQYPVEVKYTGQQDVRMIPELMAETIKKALASHPGDVLAFLPGEGEIRKCEELLKQKNIGALIHPLFGMLPPAQQYKAIMPDRTGKRRVVLATSIAETSLTIEGVGIVVDSGFTRMQKFDPRSGLSRLETVAITKDSATQRAGRAGRLSAGVCYRMWSLATQERLEDHIQPEILEADLSSVVLDLALWGIINPNQLLWLAPPPPGHVAQARETLTQLDALEAGKITEHGKAMHQLPCHPRIAHMLLMAQKADQIGLASDLAAILEERDPLAKEVGIDINLRIEKLRDFRTRSAMPRKWQRIEQVAASYRQLFDAAVDNGIVDVFETGYLLAQAYPERIACARPGNNAQFQLANGRLAMAGHQDDLAHEAWLAVAHLDARDGMGKIFLASQIDPTDLQDLVKEVENITWDTKKGGLSATRELRIGNIILQSKPLPNPDQQYLEQAIVRAIQKEGQHLLNFDEATTQLQNRVMSLKKWNPAGRWPDYSTEALLLVNGEWLSPYLKDIRKPEELRKIPLEQVLLHHLSFEQQQALQVLAPAELSVPSGSRIPIHYKVNGEQPLISVRLQEVFGLAKTPTVNNGQQSLLLQLLSPGYKPVQITGDLESFWNNTYHEVKKELKRRYPKHAWPDDPWTAEAVNGVRRRSI